MTEHKTYHELDINAGMAVLCAESGIQNVRGMHTEHARSLIEHEMDSNLLPLQERPARVVNVASKMSETCTLNMQDPLLSRPKAWNSVYAYSHSKLCQV